MNISTLDSKASKTINSTIGTWNVLLSSFLLNFQNTVRHRQTQKLEQIKLRQSSRRRRVTSVDGNDMYRSNISTSTEIFVCV